MQALHVENGIRLLGRFTGVKIVDVAVKPYSAGLSAVISIDKQFDSDLKQVLFAAFMISVLKDVTVVDADIDIRSEPKIQRAMATPFSSGCRYNGYRWRIRVAT